MPKRVWTLAATIMDLFKRNKINLSNKSKPKPGPNGSEPEFKQQYFAPIRTLKEEDQCLLLQEVIDGKLPVLGMKEAAAKMKQMEMLKSTFINLVNITSWEDAEAQLPLFANADALLQFSNLNFGTGAPQPFIDFCTRAKEFLSSPGEVTSSDEMSADDLIIKHSETDCHVSVMALPFSELYSSRIVAVDSGFIGASLVVISIEKVLFFFDVHITNCYSKSLPNSSLYTCIFSVCSISGKDFCQ